MVTNTYTLIGAVKQMCPVRTFFKDRYFPDGNVFHASKALIETKKDGRKVAPFVSPVVNGIVMDSEGYRTDEIKAPTIAPKKIITKEALEAKAFGEDPNSNRSAETRENELEAEYIDEMRSSILRRHELMCTDIITTGGTVMKHYSSAEDAANDRNAEVLRLRFYDDEFENKYVINGDFQKMSAEEKMLLLYDITAELRKRGIHCTDLVMTSDVSKLFMTDKEFLEYYNKLDVVTGVIDQIETPDGVVCNGTINAGGTKLTLFTYDEEFEDVDGQIKPFLPKGTMAFLHPKMGTTVYAEVSFVNNGHFESHAEKMVPRCVSSELNNVIELHMYSRPVPYPLDVNGWMVTNIYQTKESSIPEESEKFYSPDDPYEFFDSLGDDPEGADGSENPENPEGADGSENPENPEGAVGSENPENPEGIDGLDNPEPVLKTEAEINKLTSKDSVIEYAASIGLTGLTKDPHLADLKTAVINYQQENYSD